MTNKFATSPPQSPYLGLFFIGGGGIYTDIDSKNWSKLGQLGAYVNPGVLNEEIEKTGDISLIRCYLINMHERDHLMTILGLPIGLTGFFSDFYTTALISDIIDSFPETGEIKAPLVRTLTESKGVYHSPSDLSPLEEVYEINLNTSLYLGELNPYLKKGDIKEIAGKYGPNLIIKNPEDYIYPRMWMSPKAILEALATCQEVLTLMALKPTENIFNLIYNKHLLARPQEYWHCLNYIFEEIGKIDFFTARIILFLSMYSPLDMVYSLYLDKENGICLAPFCNHPITQIFTRKRIILT